MRHSSWVFEETRRAGVGQPAGASCRAGCRAGRPGSGTSPGRGSLSGRQRMSRRPWAWAQAAPDVPACPRRALPGGCLSSPGAMPVTDASSGVDTEARIEGNTLGRWVGDLTSAWCACVTVCPSVCVHMHMRLCVRVYRHVLGEVCVFLSVGRCVFTRM